MKAITNLTPENAQKLADALKTMGKIESLKLPKLDKVGDINLSGKIESVKLPTVEQVPTDKNAINPLLEKLDVSKLKQVSKDDITPTNPSLKKLNIPNMTSVKLPTIAEILAKAKSR